MLERVGPLQEIGMRLSRIEPQSVAQVRRALRPGVHRLNRSRRVGDSDGTCPDTSLTYTVVTLPASPPKDWVDRKWVLRAH